MIAAVDHVQVAAPPGCEDAARAFYGELLGMEEVPKPEALRPRGGVWFRAGDQELHVGVEEPFAPARKAHPALALSDAAELATLAERLTAAGHTVNRETGRFHTADPFGNRLELLAPHADLRLRALRDDERTWALGVLRESWGTDVTVYSDGREFRAAELPGLVAEAQRHGFALVGLHAGAIDAMRARKPEISATGHAGIPIRDEVALERAL